MEALLADIIKKYAKCKAEVERRKSEFDGQVVSTRARLAENAVAKTDLTELRDQTKHEFDCKRAPLETGHRAWLLTTAQQRIQNTQHSTA